jgi:hypothetical protein
MLRLPRQRAKARAWDPDLRSSRKRNSRGAQHDKSKTFSTHPNYYLGCEIKLRHYLFWLNADSRALIYNQRLLQPAKTHLWEGTDGN